MTAPIGKGSRFLVLTGFYIGREGVVTEFNRTELLDWYRLDIGDGEAIDTVPAELTGPGFKRLADAPAEVDPIVVEIDALARAVDMEAIGQAGGVADAIRDALNGEEDGEDDEDWYASRRLLFVDIAALALAGVRDIDRRRKP